MTNNQYELVRTEYNDILDGAGWCTDDYILNFISDVIPEEKCLFELMLLLAAKGKLWYESELPEWYNSDEEPDAELIPPMSLSGVIKEYGHMRDSKSSKVFILEIEYPGSPKKGTQVITDYMGNWKNESVNLEGYQEVWKEVEAQE